jgi:hypothetical protein
MDMIDRHFAAENAHDVEATLATYTDDIVWDDVTHPDAPFRGKEEVGAVYGSIIDAIPDVHLESVKRFATADGKVVDESILTGHVHGPGRASRVAVLRSVSGSCTSSRSETASSPTRTPGSTRSTSLQQVEAWKADQGTCDAEGALRPRAESAPGGRGTSEPDPGHAGGGSASCLSTLVHVVLVHLAVLAAFVVIGVRAGTERRHRRPGRLHRRPRHAGAGRARAVVPRFGAGRVDPVRPCRARGAAGDRPGDRLRDRRGRPVPRVRLRRPAAAAAGARPGRA